MSVSSSESPRRHPRYWLPNGTTVVYIEHDLFKIDETPLSSKLGSLPLTEISGERCFQFPESWDIKSKDFEIFLDYFRQQKSLKTSAFEDVAILLRITSPEYLDLSYIHSSARERLESLFPNSPTPYFRSDHVEEGLVLAIKYDIPSIQKQLYYNLVTTSNIGTEDHAEEHHPLLDSFIVKRCTHLMTSLIEHFTPILFTVSTTASHMACTDIFAEHWMDHVISPALSDDGVSQPIETLQNIIDVDWKSLGMCDECLAQKKVEWRGEMDVVWEKIDGWLREV